MLGMYPGGLFYQWWPSQMPKALGEMEATYINGFLKLLHPQNIANPMEMSPWTRFVLPILTLLFISVGLGVFIFHALTNWTRTARLVNKFPGPRSFPFFGNFNHLMCPPEDWQKNLTSLFSKYGRCCRIWFSYKPFLIIADGKIAEKVLAGIENIEKGDQYIAFNRVLGHGLVTAPGNKWKKDRKLLNPGFGYQYFEGFLKIFNEQSRIMVQVYQETFPKGMEQVNLLPYIARCTMDSVFQTVLGTNRGLQTHPEEQYAERVYGLVHCTREKMLRPWLHWPIIWHLFGMGREEDKLIDGLMEDLGLVIDKKFEEKRTTGEVTGIHTRPFIAFLMDAIDDKKDIAFQINTLCATGSETTSSGLNYLLFLLALNPEYQTKIVEELDSIFGDDPSRDLTLADISDLKYMEMCIKEGLRIYPSVPGWFRKLSTDVCLDDGKNIPRGTQVTILPWDIHRNPEVFPDPERYDPERFHPDNRDKIGSSGWLAFSSGPRNCIGHRYGLLQMKTMLTHILRNFTIHTENNREDLRVIYGIVLEPVPEIKLTLRSRK